MARKNCLDVSCKNCKYHSKVTKTITRHPTSSSCVWIDKTIHKCDRLNKIIDTKFGMISKMIADHNEEKYKDADKMPTTLLQAFRHTAEYLNSDISTLNVLINASIQKTKDAAYICGYIEAKNKTNEE